MCIVRQNNGAVINATASRPLDVYTGEVGAGGPLYTLASGQRK